LSVQQFLSKKRIESNDDLELQTQLFAYTVAKHYGVSLVEVYAMPVDIFKQSLVWALAVEDERNKEAERRQKQSSTSNETVDFDYSFLEMEDF
tara:strand:+ start:362 stop:640 length:279 start_codon:yes stop_codon:yes gene_type:complete